MIDFGLLLGHMVGDYIVQNDWMAKNKANPHPGRHPASEYTILRILGARFVKEQSVRIGEICNLPPDPVGDRNIKIVEEWESADRAWWRGHLACTVHCLLYTLAVWACSFWWMPWWGLVACFVAHWPIDRFALAGRWMRNVSGQKFFASKEHPMWPNSIVLVDNTFHLLTLFAIGLIARGF